MRRIITFISQGTKGNRRVLSAVLITLISVFSLILSLSSLIETPQIARAGWYSDSAWLYRQKIIIDHTKVANTDQVDFPVLIKITNPYSGVFVNAKDDGADILFTSDDGDTKLSHEIDFFSKTSKELIAWVKVQTLSASADTVLYMYYGNTEATDQQNQTEVWSNGYTGAWHLNESGTGSVGDFQDSTASNHNSVNTTSQPTVIDTVVGKGQRFLSNSYINAGDGSASFASGDFAMSIWMENYASGYRMLSWGNSGPTMWVTSGNSFSLVHAGTIDIQSQFHPGSARTHLVVSRSGSDVALYANGVRVAQNANFNVAYSASGNIGIGANYGGTYTDYITATLDEPRLSTSRSADWIATEYNNQANPEGFISLYHELSQENYNTATETEWISSAWLYKQKIRITNNTAANVYDIPVLISSTALDLSNVYAKAKANGEDIRFASIGSSVELPHYIQSYSSAGSYAQIYVKVSYLPASGSTDIYLYYGNSNADVSASNGARTFASFDDFSGDSLSSIWTLTNGNGSISQSGGALSFNYVGAENNDWWNTGRQQKILKLNSLPSDNFEASVKLNSYTPSISTQAGIAVYGSDTSAYTWGRYYGSGGTVNNYQLEKLGTSSIATLASTDLPKYLAVKRIGSVYSFWSSSDRINWTKTGSDYSDVAFNNIALFGKEWGTNNHVFSQDDFIVRRIAATDPTIVLDGTEETLDNIPPANPSVFTAKNVLGGEVELIAGNYYNYLSPYVEWPSIGDPGGASDDQTGVVGYYLYFGTSCGIGGADPVLTRGLLDDLGNGLHYTSDTSISTPDITTDGIYCLRLKTKDIAGNVSDVTEGFNYQFETTLPAKPSYISVSPAGYSSANSFTFTWPTAIDQESSPSAGIAGYQYKRGEGSSDEWSEAISETSIAGISSYKTGENIFMVRSVDGAGNLSDEVQTTYYYSSNPPGKPTSLSSTPSLSSSNSFAFSWTAPVHSVPIESYGYSVNAYPTSNNLTWTSDNTPSLSAGPFATMQGDNTLYLVAKDETGAFSLESNSVATVTFNCTTSAPPMPLNLTVSDSSNRIANLWALTLKWSQGTNQNSQTFDHYIIERSTNNVSFIQIATTQSLAYIDLSGLNNSTTYYYKVKAVDNAGSTSVASQVVSKSPTGRYGTPPTLVSTPVVQARANSADINWTVNRSSTSSVRFGKNMSNLDRVQINSQEDTNHLVTLDGLEPRTKYYYQVQSLDNYRDYSSESAFSTVYEFTTLDAPGIKDLTVQNITISNAEVVFETSTASTATLQYGTSINYGENIENDSKTTMHTVKLSNLNQGTTYHLKVNGVDIDGNNLSSDDYVFETLPMPSISSLTVQPDYAGPNPGIKINWKTNVPTSSSVEYIPKQGNVLEEESKSALVTEHEILLTELADNTSYRFYVYGSDQFGNVVRSSENILDTPLDSRPPKITDLHIESQNVGVDDESRAQIIVSWTTDEPATSQVEYGQGVSGDTYGNMTQNESTLSKTHTVIIGNLDSSKTYHLRAVSADEAGNLTFSEDNAVITKKQQISPLSLIISSLSKAFSWLKWFR